MILSRGVLGVQVILGNALGPLFIEVTNRGRYECIYSTFKAPRPCKIILSWQKNGLLLPLHASSDFLQIQEIWSLVLREREGVRDWVPDLVQVPTGPLSVIVLEPFLVFPLGPKPLRCFASRNWQDPRRVFLCAHLPGCESGSGRSRLSIPFASATRLALATSLPGFSFCSERPRFFFFQTAPSLWGSRAWQSPCYRFAPLPGLRAHPWQLSSRTPGPPPGLVDAWDPHPGSSSSWDLTGPLRRNFAIPKKPRLQMKC